MLPSVVGKEKAAKFIVANTLLLIPISLLFYLYLSGTGELLYLAVAIVFDLGLLATNIKLLMSPTKANAFLAFKFSSPYLAIIFLLGCVAVLICTPGRSSADPWVDIIMDCEKIVQGRADLRVHQT